VVGTPLQCPRYAGGEAWDHRRVMDTHFEIDNGLADVARHIDDTVVNPHLLT
jgi:hypothetical protein